MSSRSGKVPTVDPRPSDILVAGTLILAVFVAACVSSEVASPSGGPRTTPLPSAVASSAGGQASTDPSPGGSRTPARPWMLLPLTDVRSGATLRIADLVGKVVLIEGMATWCPPCLEQQAQASAALAELDAAKVVYVSVDIDPREPAATLQGYADRNHFPWIFATTSTEFLRELAREFGDGVLNPPATPMIVVDTEGTAALVEFGIKRASRIVELAHAHGG